MPVPPEVLALDAADPLRDRRGAFDLPPDVIYLDGNSLGALPRATASAVDLVLREQWGQGLIRSWNAAGWIDAPTRLGDKIARLVGAQVGEVLVADSSSVNLFKVLAAALQRQVGRRCIVSTRDNFPTDLYMAQGLSALLQQGHELILVDGEDDANIVAAMNDATAVVLLTHVNYRTGRMHDMARLTQAAHAQGALTIWDLAHSAGAVPLNLAAAQVDMAVGCGYKYLNGGPGAPAFVMVAQRHGDWARQPLTGWLGHAAPFDFDPVYRPAPGIASFQCGTPAILSLAALEVGVDLMLDVPMDSVRAKSLALTDLFIACLEPVMAQLDLTLVTPRRHAQRGSQVSLRHPQAYAVMQALIARGVVGDFRAPDLLRFGFTPLYTSYTDAWRAAMAVIDVLRTKDWAQAKFQQRLKVT